MKTIRNYWPLPVGLITIGVALLAMAQTVPPPVLSVAVTTNNQLSIIVTNGVSYANYVLYNEQVLGSSTWTYVTNPVPGVTNFLVNMGPYFDNFYFVKGSTNWNNGGIPNWDYADPTNPGLGVLTVTIVSPAQGQIIQ